MRMNKAELLSALRLAAKYLPPATATLMNEAATRLDVTSSALSEALAQRDAALKAQDSAPMVKALTTIANSEQHSGDTVVCDFDTLISVASGALRDYYSQQLREAK